MSSADQKPQNSTTEGTAKDFLEFVVFLPLFFIGTLCGFVARCFWIGVKHGWEDHDRSL